MPGDAKAQNDRLRTLVLRNRQTLGKLQEAIKNLDTFPSKKTTQMEARSIAANPLAGPATNP